MLRLLLCFGSILTWWVLTEGLAAVVKAPWRKGIFIGGIGFGVGMYLVIYAQKISDPVTVAIVVTSGPIIGSMLEVILDGRRLTRLLIAGLILAVLGGLVASGTRVGGGNTAMGALITLISASFYMWGSRAAVKHLSGLSNTGIAGVTFGGSAIVITILFTIFYSTGFTSFQIGPVSTSDLVGLLFYAIVAMAISQVLWFAAVSGLGIALAAFHLNATPFYVMIIMYALGGEWLWIQVLGAGLVAAGAIIAQLRPRRAKSVNR
jgi:drug/metabolite transporter (DMT)-like permease